MSDTVSGKNVTDHAATMISGTVTCDCGWTSGHHALGVDALDAYEQHLREIGDLAADTEVVFKVRGDGNV